MFDVGGTIQLKKELRIDSQKDVDSWPQLPTGSSPRDTDQDGMPDPWERRHQLDPENPDDGNAIHLTGFTNLEVYLNSLVSSGSAERVSAVDD